MAIVKVTRNYQITLPAEVRGELGIKVGDLLRVAVSGGRIVIEKLEDDLPAFKLGKRIGDEEVEQALRRGLLRQLGALDGSSGG